LTSDHIYIILVSYSYVRVFVDTDTALQLFTFMLFMVVYDMLDSSEPTYEGFNMCL